MNGGNAHRRSLDVGERCKRSVPAPDCAGLWRTQPAASSLRHAHLLTYAHAELEQHMGHAVSPMPIPRLVTFESVTGKRLVQSLFDVRPDATQRAFGSSAARCAQVPASRVAATVPWCAREGRFRDQEFGRDWSASAGFLDSPAQGTYQACVACGRRELLAAPPTPLLRQSPLESFEERIALAHAAPYRPPRRGGNVCASAGMTRCRQCTASLPSDSVQDFSVIAGSHLEEDAPLAIVCGRDCCGPSTTSSRLRRRFRLGLFGPPNAWRRTGGGRHGPTVSRGDSPEFE